MFPRKRQYTLSTVVCAIALSVLCGASSAQAFSQVLSFQGRLCATDGKPVPDGHYSVQFTIYDAAIGGNSLWQETQDVTQIGGVFAVRLGSVSPFQPDLFTGGDRWLGIKVGADPEMADRFPFTPSPWAFYAASSGPDNDWTISGANIYRLGGNVGIGLTSPGYTLHVQSAGERAIFADAVAHSGTNYGVYGRLASTAGAGVFGEATAATGTANGVAGFTATAEGSGVYGQNTSQTGDNKGVYGVAWSPQAKGVMGYNGASSGSAVGVLGRTNSSDGYGVRGEAVRTSGRSYGVYGDTASTEGIGVYGNASAASGMTRGGWFRTSSTEGWGVMGYATAASGETQGVHGESESPDGVGVFGTATASSGYARGVHGESASADGVGVLGYSTASSGYARGVVGVNSSTAGMGVQGIASATEGTAYGVFGQAYGTHGAGVLGWSRHNFGVWGRQDDSGNQGILATSLAGVYGEASIGVGVSSYNDASKLWADLATSTHAGYFYGDVHTTEEYTKAYTTGTANLATPIAYATIDRATGNVLAGTPNVSGTWNSTLNRYEITISGENYNFNTHVTTVTPIGGDYRASTDAADGKLLVFIRDASGYLAQRWFSFVTYKP
jgi:hypothetical protein